MSPSLVLPFLSTPLLTTVLLAHQFQADSNNCGPYCTASVIQALKNIPISGAQVAMEMNSVDWSTFPPVISRIRDWATFPWGIIHYLKKKTISSRLLVLQQPEKLVASLAAGNLPIVLIGGFKPAWAHYMIMLSTHPDLGLGFCNPAYPHPEVHWLNSEIFLDQWKAYGRTFIEVLPQQ